MRFRWEENLIPDGEFKNVLLPYFTETDRMEQLSQIIQEEQARREAAMAVRKKFNSFLLFSRNVHITFMDLGKSSEFKLETIIRSFRAYGRQIKDDTVVILKGLAFPGQTIFTVTEAIIKAMYHGGYDFSKNTLKQVEGKSVYCFRDALKEEKDSLTVTFVHCEDLCQSIKKASDYGQCINYARMLGDLPNNYLHISQFREYVKEFAAEYGLSCEVLGNRELKELHSGGILGVNAGTAEEANLITLFYKGSGDAPVTALVGKAVLFDSGGYHLKSLAGMEGMKYDMCGAANLLAALEIAIRQNSSQNLLLVLPAVENVISPNACKMGDVLTTMSGKTVEVYNTDAEGRLILCDALTYAIKKGADRVLDLATLTYSCQRALGDHISGAFSNQDEFYEAFLEKTKEECEKIWRLPLDDTYRRELKRSTVADLINYAPESGGGASFAACFLEEFVNKGTPWIHLDIVGTAVNRKENTISCMGATGVLTASIAAFLEQ